MLIWIENKLFFHYIYYKKCSQFSDIISKDHSPGWGLKLKFSKNYHGNRKRNINFFIFDINIVDAHHLRHQLYRSGWFFRTIAKKCIFTRVAPHKFFCPVFAKLKNFKIASLGIFITFGLQSALINAFNILKNIFILLFVQ